MKNLLPSFKQTVKTILSEMNIAGGTTSVFGTTDAGSTGNQFPAQNDKAYAPGDSRLPSLLGSTKKNKKKKPIIQRRGK